MVKNTQKSKNKYKHTEMDGDFGDFYIGQLVLP